MRIFSYLAVAVILSLPLQAQDLVPLVQGLNQPVFMTHAGDGSERLFIVERGGRIRIWKAGQVLSQPFLDISDQVRTDGEFGFLGLAFHPDYRDNGRFFVYYSPLTGSQRTVLAEYGRSPNSPDRASPSETLLLTIEQPQRNHNGGTLAFGPDGMLYLGLGDGGGGGDPDENAQDLSEILGSMLRLDVDRPSLIPPDNPFINTPGARGEIWAYGLRNPFRFSFDRQSGRLFLGDVGQNRFEEVDIIERGQNYGWDIVEGDSCFEPMSGCDMSGLTPPIHVYPRDDGRSVTGGYVYRGQRFPFLRGRYIFGDFTSGRIWALRELQNGTWTRTTLFNRDDIALASFAEDEAGELYVVDLTGRIFQLAEDGPDLTVEKSHSGTFRVGETGEFRVLVVNQGVVSTRSPITLEDSLPEGVTLNRIQAPSWTCSNQGQDVSCTRQLALGPGETSLVRIFVDVQLSAIPRVINRASVDTDDDVNPANNSDSDTASVLGQVDLSLAGEADLPFLPGIEAAYLLVVRNHGQAATLQPVALTAEFTEGVTPLAADGVNWTCQLSASSAQCSLGPPLIPDAERTLKLSVMLEPEVLSPVEASFLLDSPEDDNPDNDSLTLQTPVQEPVNLSVQARLEHPLRPGQQTQLAIRLSGQTAQDVVALVTAELPPGLEFVSTQSGGWSCTPNNPVLCQSSQSIDAPDPQEPERLDLTLQVSPQASGLLLNRVLLEADFDAFLPDNESLQAVAVAQPDDGDGDGVPDSQEDAAWPQGDGNGDAVADRLQSRVASLRTAEDIPVTLVTQGAALALVAAQDDSQLDLRQLNGVDSPMGSFDFSLVDLDPPASVGGAGQSGVFVISDRNLGNQAFLFSQDGGPRTQLPFPRPAGQEGAEIGTHSIFLALIDGGTFDADSRQNGVITVQDLASGRADDAPRIRFFPQVGDGTPHPIRFQTEINLLNTGGQQTARLDLRQASSEAMPLLLQEIGRESQLDIALAEGGTFTVQSDGSGDARDSSLQTGYARLVALPSVETVLVFRRSDARQEVILYEAGIPATRSLQEATLFVDSLGGRQTGVAILNPPEVIASQGDSFSTPQVPSLAAEVSLELRGLDFQLLAQTTLALADGEQRAAFLEELFDQSTPSPAENLQGLLLIRSDRPVAVLGLRQNDRPGVEFPDDVATLAPLPVAESVFQPADQPSPAPSSDK